MHKIFRNKKILIAGGAGLVGTNLTEHLVKQKANITSSFFSKIKNKKLKKYYKKFNFLDMIDCLKATKNIDFAILCAVDASGVGNMITGNLYNQNLKNTILRSNFFEACKINNIKNIVWVSSSTVYQPKKGLISEKELNLNLKPYNIYGSIGLAYRYIEQLANYYNEKFVHFNFRVHEA